MSAVTNIWRQLVQRRLWPVAILLVAALAAVPLMLAKDPEPEAMPPVATTPAEGEDVLATTPIVAMETTAESANRGKVLGNKKNPFAVPEPAKTSDQDAEGDPADAETEGSSSGGTSTDSGDAGSGGAPTTPVSGGDVPLTPTTPTEPQEPAKSYDKYDLTVRFGESTGERSKLTLQRLQPLPKANLPALIYLGVSGDGKSAIFLVDQGVEPVGDGVCLPTPDQCETLRLKAGETEFLDVLDEGGTVATQYQLDLVKIHKGSTASASAASASSKAGRKLLSARAETVGALPYRFDADTGTVERRSSATRASGNVAQASGTLR
jgi:hypothetical protein